MLQMPPVQPSAAKPAQTDVQNPAGEQGAFAELLAAVGSDLPPGELRAEVLQQVQDGVPLEQVLADLVRRLEEDSEQLVPAAMMPTLNAVVQELAVAEPMLPGRWQDARLLAQQPPAAEGAEGGEEVVADLLEAPDFELERSADLPGAERLAGKDKAPLFARVLAPEAAAGLPIGPTAAPPQGLRPLDLPQSLSALLPASQQGDAAELLTVQPRVGESGWGQVLAQRVMWMIGREQQSAQLRLNPAELGPIEVKLSLHHDQASVSLLASNGAVRDALEQALPRLRDMLGQQDIQLVQVNVGQREASGGHQAAAEQGGRHAGAGHGGAGQTGAAHEEESTSMVRVHSRGLVDAYA